MRTLQTLNFDRALLPALAGAVLSVASFTGAGTLVKSRFPVITVGLLASVGEPLPAGLRFRFHRLLNQVSRLYDHRRLNSDGEENQCRVVRAKQEQ
jgi:hypothetical protein